jgi:hypothetical protein
MRVVDRRDDVRAVLSVEDHASERWISGSHFREARIVVTDCPLRNRRNAQENETPDSPPPQRRVEKLDGSAVARRLRRDETSAAATPAFPARVSRRHPRRLRTRRGARRARSARGSRPRVGSGGAPGDARRRRLAVVVKQKFRARRSGAFRFAVRLPPARDPVGGRLETPPREATPRESIRARRELARVAISRVETARRARPRPSPRASSVGFCFLQRPRPRGFCAKASFVRTLPDVVPTPPATPPIARRSIAPDVQLRHGRRAPRERLPRRGARPRGRRRGSSRATRASSARGSRDQQQTRGWVGARLRGRGRGRKRRRRRHEEVRATTRER